LHQPALDFYHLSKDKLAPALSSQARRERVNEFINQNSNLARRFELASLIVADSKSHHGAVKAQDVSWVTLHKYASIGEHQNTVAELTAAERADFFTVTNYRYFGREAARLWQTISDFQERDRDPTYQQFQAAIGYSSQRDRLAANIAKVPARYRLGLTHTNTQLSHVYKHAERHLQRVIDVGQWQEQRCQVLARISEITDQSGGGLQDCYSQWQQVIAQEQSYQRPSYQAACQQWDINPTQFAQDKQLLDGLKQLLPPDKQAALAAGQSAATYYAQSRVATSISPRLDWQLRDPLVLVK